MKKQSLLIALLAISLGISGCSSKSKVAFDESRASEQSAPVAQTVQEPVQSKVQQVETAVDSSLSYLNTTTSNINGQDISLKSIHFEFDKYSLTQEMREVEKANYNVIDPVVNADKEVKIMLEGNTDEFGSDEYNMALGLKRAKAVKKTLVNFGIPSNIISIKTLGEGNPLCTEKTEECYKRNRRVDHKLQK